MNDYSKLLHEAYGYQLDEAGSFKEARDLRKAIRPRVKTEFNSVHQFKNMSWAIGKFNKTKKIVGKIWVPSITEDGKLTIGASIGTSPPAFFKVDDYSDAQVCITKAFKWLRAEMEKSGVEGY